MNPDSQPSGHFMSPIWSFADPLTILSKMFIELVFDSTDTTFINPISGEVENIR